MNRLRKEFDKEKKFDKNKKVMKIFKSDNKIQYQKSLKNYSNKKKILFWNWNNSKKNQKDWINRIKDLMCRKPNNSVSNI